MKVWVVMGNDYPDAVFDLEELAKDYVLNKEIQEDKHRKEFKPKVYWRTYECELIRGVP